MNYINQLSVGQKVMSLIVVELLSFSLVTTNAITQIGIVGEEVEKMSSFYLPAFSSVQMIRELVLRQRLNFQEVINIGETVVYDKDAKRSYQQFRDGYEAVSEDVSQAIISIKELIAAAAAAEGGGRSVIGENFTLVFAALDQVDAANEAHNQLAIEVFQHVEDGSFLMGREMLILIVCLIVHQ